MKKFTFIVGPGADSIEVYLKDGKKWNVEINYLMTQDFTKGPAHSLLLAKNIFKENFLTALSDELYFGTDFRPLLEAMDSNVSAVCGVLSTDDQGAIKKNYAVNLHQNQINELIEKPDRVINQFIGVGLFIFSPKIFNAIEMTPSSVKTGKVELIEAINTLAKNDIVKPAYLSGKYFNINTENDYFDALKFSQKTSLIIPTLNEAEALPETIKDFKSIVDEVIIIDNQSSDNTAELARDLGATVHSVNVDGYGAALRVGLQKSSGNILILMEGDNTFRAKGLKALLSELHQCDLVIGSRTNQEFNPAESPMTGSLRLGNMLFGKIIKFFWPEISPAFTDVGCTYRVMWRDSYLKIADALKTNGPEFIVDMTVEALNKGLTVREIPISYYPRTAGVSKHSSNFYKTATTAKRMLKVILHKRMKSLHEEV